MKHALLLIPLTIALSACATAPSAPLPTAPAPAPARPSAAASGYSETQIAPGRYRVTYNGPAAMSDREIQDRALRRAAQLTLDKGNQWFEIADQARGLHKHSIEIIIGKGESLAGGKTYDARETLRGPTS
ncbi:MAG: hypothetical protein SGJ21_17500 [Alphaproteobacteria bacterium]|nr:hypothetical protein [Alphaproteobacteria bacterium]